MPKAHHILLIEDDQDLIQLYRIGLEKAGFVVSTSDNGFHGLSKAMEKDIDLILLDLMMPMSDGKDVLSLLDLHQKSRQIPVVIISNLDPDTVDLTGLDSQVLDYWLKSELTPKTLAAKVKALLS